MVEAEAARPRRVLLIGSYAPALLNFRGPLIEDLVRAGHEVVAAAPDIDAEIAAGVRALGAEPRSVPLSRSSLNPLDMLATYRRLRRLVREVRPDVVIAYTIKPATLGTLAARAEGVPRILLLITGLGFAFTEGGGVRRAVSRAGASVLYRLALRRADAVLFQNPDDLAVFVERGLLAPATPRGIVNGSGIDLDRFPPAPLPLGLSFLMMGRFLGDKGIREFGAAARRIKASHPQVRIRLAGFLEPSPDSISQAELDEILAGGVESLGKLDDVRQALADCSVYVLPSYREGTPRSVLEAMATGRPVITTDAPGCRETVVDGVNGFLVPPRDADALHAAMERFVADPGLIAPMGRAGRAMAEERYDVRKVNAEIMRRAGL